MGGGSYSISHESMVDYGHSIDDVVSSLNRARAYWSNL